MNKSPSQKLTDLLTSTGVRVVHYEELRILLEQLRNELRADEAAAYRGLQASSEYKVISKLIEKSNELTGRIN